MIGPISCSAQYTTHYRDSLFHKLFQFSDFYFFLYYARVTHESKSLKKLALYQLKRHSLFRSYYDTSSHLSTTLVLTLPSIPYFLFYCAPILHPLCHNSPSTLEKGRSERRQWRKKGSKIYLTSDARFDASHFNAKTRSQEAWMWKWKWKQKRKRKRKQRLVNDGSGSKIKNRNGSGNGNIWSWK